MIRHVDVRAIRRHAVGAGRREIDIEQLDDAPAEPARALVDGLALEATARRIDESRRGDPRHRTEHAQAVEQAHRRQSTPRWDR